MAMKVHARSAGFRGYPVEAGSAELDARDFEVELEEGTETLELLPPAELEEVELTTGGLPFEVWRRLAGFLDASALSEAMSVATMFTLPTAAEAELWANLVQLDFPKMYSSIIAECAGGSMEKQTSSRKSSKNSAKEGRRRPAGTGHARGGRLWRGVQLETHDGRDENHPADPVGDMQVWPYCTCSDDVICEVCSSLLATSTATPGSSPLGSPWLQNHRSPLPSPALSFQLEPSPALSYTASPAMRLVANSSSSSPAFGATGGDAIPSLAAVEWKKLYKRRWRKKVDWESQKQAKMTTRDRATSSASGGGSETPNAASAGGAEGEAKRPLFSDLTRAELGRLSDAANRLRICSHCGEKFSPGEARKQPTSCCYHSGDFTPKDLQGWSRNDLKQLRQFARQALRNAGGASWVKRHPRASRGHGHWARGLGIYASDMNKIRRCLEGEAGVYWSCCGAEELFAEGCQRGTHRCS
mmetsp:Transcript_16497/g.38059  ORF Transcript_16497/g.38059 Transcript_16497/m.38059 type:complete len:471 (+) Transcript_16497:50-1462(+)